ncbi:MAG: tetratricopeptide repeat protein [Candidatus Hodarchaeota archaeon]
MKNSNNTNQIFEEAITLKSQERYKEALEILERLYADNPNSEEIKNTLINTLFDYGGHLNDYYTLEYEKAKQVFKRITDLSPSDYRAHYNLGIAYFNLNQMEKAKISFDTALKIKPDYKYCLYNLGLIYEEMEKYEEALIYYEKALEIDPSFSYALAAQSEIRRIIHQLKRMKVNQNY